MFHFSYLFIDSSTLLLINCEALLLIDSGALLLIPGPTLPLVDGVTLLLALGLQEAHGGVGRGPGLDQAAQLVGHGQAGGREDQ